MQMKYSKIFTYSQLLKEPSEAEKESDVDDPEAISDIEQAKNKSLSDDEDQDTPFYGDFRASICGSNVQSNFLF